jgi:inosose dehydratase
MVTRLTKHTKPIGFLRAVAELRDLCDEYRLPVGEPAPGTANRMISIANAPCSWGVLEFEEKTASPGYQQVLDEIAQTGYAGTELGDWAFMPTEPRRLQEDLTARGLAMVGAFVTTRLVDSRSYNESRERAVKTARLLAAVALDTPPVIVLSDEPTAEPYRARAAGRVTPALGFPDEWWDTAAEGVGDIARAVRDEAGLRTVFHHHCATFVETPAEVDALMKRTEPDLVGLCLDTGHATFGGGSPEDLLERHRSRVWHVHFKDCEPTVASRARAEGWDYHTALRHGLFCELGEGAVDFPALLRVLERSGYDGWIVVEQDVLPAMGAPLDSARRNRQYLREIGI